MNRKLLIRRVMKLIVAWALIYLAQCSFGSSYEIAENEMSSFLLQFFKAKVTKPRPTLILMDIMTPTAGFPRLMLNKADLSQMESSIGLKMAHFIHNNAAPVIAILRLSDSNDADVITGVMRAMSLRSYSGLVLIGTQDPTQVIKLVPAKSEKDTFYFHEKGNMVAIYGMCPGHLTKGPLLVNIYKNKTYLKPLENIFSRCPHQFIGNKMNVAFNGLPPSIYVKGFTLTGYDIELVKLMGEKYKFNPTFKLGEYVGYDVETRTFDESADFFQVVRYNATFAVGTKCMHNYEGFFVDFSFNGNLDINWATRNPIELRTFLHFARPFSDLTWGLTWLALFICAILFCFIFWVYKKKFGASSRLLRHEEKYVKWLNFLIFPLTKFTEPEPIPWFPRFSAGMILATTWAGFSMFVVFFYSSNLRAKLISKEYEKGIDTSKDVLERGADVYIPKILSKFDHMNPLNEGVLSPDIEAISKRVHDGHGSFVDFTFAGLLSEEWLKNVKENGAVFLLSRDIIMYQYLFEKDQGLPNFITSKEADVMHCGFTLRKNSPYKEDVDRFLGQTSAMGFVKKFSFEHVSNEALVLWTPNQDQSENRPLRIEHFEGIVYCSLLGLFISGLMFILELVLCNNKILYHL